jgi:alpha-1,2-mannosyltransferase
VNLQLSAISAASAVWESKSVSAPRWLESLRQVAVAALTGRNPGSTRLLLRLAVVFCAVVGLYDALTIVLYFQGGPYIGPQRSILFPDFIVFHAASRAFQEGKLGVIYQLAAFSDFENLNYSEYFKQPVDFRPFMYPPTWLLLTIPLAWFGVVAAYSAFLAATAALATFLAGRSNFWIWMATLTSPAALWTMISGQNAFLNIGLFYGGMRLVDRSPAAAGILLGVLSYKPQLSILVPVALLAARRWRVLAWMIGTAVAMALASLAVFGLEFWLQFFEMARERSGPEFAALMFQHVSSYITTILVAGRILGLPPTLASVAQLAGALTAVIVVWRAFSRHEPSDEATAVLAAGTLLVSPYLINYDLLLLMPAALMVFRRRVEADLHPGELLFYVGLWLIPNIGVRLNGMGIPLMPVFVAGLLFLAWQALKQRASALPRAA